MSSEAMTHSTDVWKQIAAPLPPGSIEWRQDGKPEQRGQKFIARFVAYIEAGTVRERLDSVVPGEWGLELEPLAVLPGAEGDELVSFKARVSVLGVIRECVGTGKDYKQAATDAFKRAAVRFGIGHELYAMERLWVEMDGDGKYARPVEDPADAYARKYGGGATPEGRARAIGQQELPMGSREGRAAGRQPEKAAGASNRELLAALLKDPDVLKIEGDYAQTKLEDADVSEEFLGQVAAKLQENLAKRKAGRIRGAGRAAVDTAVAKRETRPPSASGRSNDGASDPECPKCGSEMWDNRADKKNPKAPDFKCKERGCDGVIWPPRKEKPVAAGHSEGDLGEDDEGLPY